MNELRIGYRSLLELYESLHLRVVQSALPQVFSYFDCTDYVEDGKRFLSLVSRKTDSSGRLMTVSAFQHIRLLLYYLVRNIKLFQRIIPNMPDVHSGYFDTKELSRLIYRLACFGFDASEATYVQDRMLD